MDSLSVLWLLRCFVKAFKHMKTLMKEKKKRLVFCKKGR